MSALELYLLFTVIPAVLTLCKIAIGLTAILFIVVIMGYDEMDKDDGMKGALRRCMIWLKVIAPVTIILFVLLPSKNEIKTIIGGAYVTNIENIGELPENMVDAANEFLKNMNEDK